MVLPTGEPEPLGPGLPAELAERCHLRRRWTFDLAAHWRAGTSRCFASRVRHRPGPARQTPCCRRGARQGDQQLVATRRAADAGEAMAEDAAPQVARKLLGDEGWHLAAGIAIGGLAKERGQVLGDDAVQQRPLGLPTLVAKRRIGEAVCGVRRIRCGSEHRAVPITSRAKHTLHRCVAGAPSPKDSRFVRHLGHRP